MPISTVESLLSKLKKVAKRPTNSKYYKKFLLLAKKQQKKLQKKKKLPNSYLNPNFKCKTERLIDISDSSSDDSGISQNSIAEYEPAPVFTHAVIEPPSKTYLKTETNQIHETYLPEYEPATVFTHALIEPPSKIFLKNETNKIHEGYLINKRTNEKENSYLSKTGYDKTDYPTIKTKHNVDSQNYNNDSKRCSNSLYQTALGYSTLRKWKNTSLIEHSGININAHQQGPKKPPRLYLKARAPKCPTALDQHKPFQIKQNTSQPSYITKTNISTSLGSQTASEILENIYFGLGPSTSKTYKSSIPPSEVKNLESIPNEIQMDSGNEFQISNLEENKDKTTKISKLKSESSENKPNKISCPEILSSVETKTKNITNTLGCKTTSKNSEDIPVKVRNGSENAFKIQPLNNQCKTLKHSTLKSQVAITNLETTSNKLQYDSVKSCNAEITSNKNETNKCSTLRSQGEHEITNINSLKTEDIKTPSSPNNMYTEFKEGLPSNLKKSDEDVDEKFIVNIFESRQSKRWKRQSLRVNDDKMKVLNDPPKGMTHKKTPVDSNKKADISQEEVYFKMKKLRDIECVKMKEASNALWMIRNSHNRSWSEELLAEKILLETELRYKAIVNKIREDKSNDTSMVSAGVTLSNFQFELATQEQKKKNDSTTFYIMAVSHDTEIITTKPVQSSDDNKVVFNETFSLQDLNENFKVKVEIYSMEINMTKIGIMERLLKKKTKCCYPIKKIYYENVNTYELQESSILKPSFTSCGEIVLSKADLGSSLFLLQKFQGNKLKNNLTAKLSVDFVNLKTKHSGFLTLGNMDEERNLHYWERKWCTLANKTFSIYNYPQDEEFDRPPVAIINLEYCFIPVIKNPKDCPRKKTFVIKTGRPSTPNDSNFKQLRRKNNFILNKYFLSADSSDEFDKWTKELDLVLAELDAWEKLIFKDDYYL